MSVELIKSSVWGKFSPNRDGSIHPTSCRDCGEIIFWVEKPDGKKDRVNAKTDKIHYYECPNKPQRGQAAPPPQNRPAPQNAGPVWTGVVEMDAGDDPEWYAVRIRVPNSDARLAVGDRVKVMKQS